MKHMYLDHESGNIISRYYDHESGNIITCKVGDNSMKNGTVPDTGDVYIEGTIYMYLDNESGDVEETPVQFSLSTNEGWTQSAPDNNILAKSCPVVVGLQDKLNSIKKGGYESRN